MSSPSTGFKVSGVILVPNYTVWFDLYILQLRKHFSSITDGHHSSQDEAKTAQHSDLQKCRKDKNAEQCQADKIAVTSGGN